MAAESDGTVRCANLDCKAEIGKLHPLTDGLSLLDLGGGALASHYIGRCKICGTLFYFSLNEQKLDRLIKHIQEQR